MFQRRGYVRADIKSWSSDRIETSDGGKNLCKNKKGITKIIRNSAMSRTRHALGNAQNRVLK